MSIYKSVLGSLSITKSFEVAQALHYEDLYKKNMYFKCEKYNFKIVIMYQLCLITPMLLLIYYESDFSKKKKHYCLQFLFAYIHILKYFEVNMLIATISIFNWLLFWYRISLYSFVIGVYCMKATSSLDGIAVRWL